MPRERLVHIVDDEAKVLDALTVLLSTASIEFARMARLKTILH